MNPTLIVLGLAATFAAHAAEHGDPQEVDAASQAVAPAPLKKEPSVAARDVKAALSRTEGVPADVHVTTHAETLVLTGEVGSHATAARVVSIAEREAGGLRVSSDIEVRAGEEQVADQRTVQLVRDVEQALRRDPRTAELGVAVSIDEQQVIGLHGLVPSRTSRTAAEDVAGRVAGVGKVRSHIVIPAE